MTPRICDACETVRHCSRNGCVPLIQGNSSASTPGAHMPVTFEGDEPGDCWAWITDMRSKVVRGFALWLLVMAAALATAFVFIYR